MKFQVADCGAELWFGRKGECCLNWLDAFPVSSLWAHQQRAQWVRSLVAARRHRKPTVSRPTCQYSSQLRVCVPAPPPDCPGIPSAPPPDGPGIPSAPPAALTRLLAPPVRGALGNPRLEGLAPADPGRGRARPAAARTGAAGGGAPVLEPGFAAMTVSARAFWLLRGRLGRVSALGRSAASLLAAPGTAGRAFRGFRSSGLRYERSRTLDLLGSGRSRVRSRWLWEGRRPLARARP